VKQGYCIVCRARTAATCDTCDYYLCRFCGTRYHLCYGAWYRECPQCEVERCEWEATLNAP